MKNKIINSHCMEGLKQLADQSVNCCVTSPPYFGLRDYGMPDQIGLEETPEQFVSALVDVFREVKRVLKNDGTLWLNLGDSYGAKGGDIFTGFNERYNGTGIGGMKQAETGKSAIAAGKGKSNTGLPAKNLLGIPWRVAFALQADGWILRQDIIWHKPNPMPESVTDRCTKSHEYIFLLSKSGRYYYDAEAIKQEANPDTSVRDRDNTKLNNVPGRSRMAGLKVNGYEVANKRSVWTVTTKPFNEAHFATFPEDLIVDCIKAGCPIDGTVLDPFMGAGTTALVARKLNRNFIGFELNPDYIRIAEKRLYNELGMFQ
jgi:DNA modification methylase